jgi:uncharacterized Zn finger protein (UPF0148 family)
LAEERWVYRCPKCGRVVEKAYPGRYFCAVCGPSAIMVPVKPEYYEAPQSEVEKAVQLIKRHPAMHAVWNVLAMDKTLTSTTKNVLWQDFVAAWNRRGLLTNEEAELAIKARFG